MLQGGVSLGRGFLVGLGGRVEGRVGESRKSNNEFEHRRRVQRGMLRCLEVTFHTQGLTAHGCEEDGWPLCLAVLPEDAANLGKTRLSSGVPWRTWPSFLGKTWPVKTGGPRVGEGSGAMPARLVAGDTLADACCCASMPQVGASADIIVMEGWGRKGVISNLGENV